MSVLGKRIADRLIDLGHGKGGQTWLANQVGMRQQGIQAIIAGRSERPRKLREIAAALDTTQDYLLGDTDDPALPHERTHGPNPEDETAGFREPDSDFGYDAYKRESYQPKIPGALPELDAVPGAGEDAVGDFVAIQVGGETGIGHAVTAEWYFPPEYLRSEAKVAPNHTIVMPVVGDSMIPTYQPGDRVLVDLTQNELVADSTVYVISDGQSPPQINRLTRILFSDPPEVDIISDNVDQAKQRVELDRLVIIGRVCGLVARR